MANIHMTLQGKGGVGKSLIASVLAQYKAHKNELSLCVDTDPVNTSFQGFKDLNVRCLDIMKKDIIDARQFDLLINWLSEITHDAVIDNGASVFIPMANYLINYEIPDVLASMNHKLFIHTVIVGGQAFPDTINGFAQLVNQFPENTHFIVWLNEYFGSIEYDNMTFEEMKPYTENKHRIHALLKWPELQKETFGYDLSHMLCDRLTFKEALACPERWIMTKQRLKMIRDRLFIQLDGAMI